MVFVQYFHVLHSITHRVYALTPTTIPSDTVVSGRPPAACYKSHLLATLLFAVNAHFSNKSYCEDTSYSVLALRQRSHPPFNQHFAKFMSIVLSITIGLCVEPIA